MGSSSMKICFRLLRHQFWIINLSLLLLNNNFTFPTIYAVRIKLRRIITLKWIWIWIWFQTITHLICKIKTTRTGVWITCLITIRCLIANNRGESHHRFYNKVINNNNIRNSRHSHQEGKTKTSLHSSLKPNHFSKLVYYSSNNNNNKSKGNPKLKLKITKTMQVSPMRISWTNKSKT